MLTQTVVIFCEVFANYDAIDVVMALEKHLREASEFPTPADITAILKSTMKGIVRA